MNTRPLRRYVWRASNILDSIESQSVNAEAVAAARPLIAMADWVADRIEQRGAPDPALVAGGIFTAVAAVARPKLGAHWTAVLAGTAARMALIGVSFAMNAEMAPAGSKVRAKLLASAEEHMLRAEKLIADTLPREDFAVAAA